MLLLCTNLISLPLYAPTVSFDMMAKSDVNGSNTNDVFKFLKSEKSGLLGTTGIKWNFTSECIHPIFL